MSVERSSCLRTVLSLSPEIPLYVQNFFSLSEDRVDKLNEIVPQFGYNGYGEIVYYRTYSRKKPANDSERDRDNWTGQENWHDTVLRAINGTFSIRKDHYLKNHIPWDENRWQAYALGFGESLIRMEWMPPGRGLWAMGTPFVYERGSMALYNCFSGDTKFLDGHRLVSLEDSVNQNVSVLTRAGYKDATVKCFGSETLKTLIFKPVMGGGRTNYRLKYKATRNHRWILHDGTVTERIQVGDRITMSPRMDISKTTQSYLQGKNHGLIFADGSQNTYYKDRFQIRLCGQKNKHLTDLEADPRHRTTCEPQSYEGDHFVTFVTENNLKAVPSDSYSLEYKLGFLEGWLAGDGTLPRSSDSIKLDTTSLEGVEWLEEWSTILGYTLIGHNIANNPTNYGERNYPLHRLTFTQEEINFALEMILDKKVEELVYCVMEPETKSFTLSGGALTGNCAFTNLTSDNLSDDLEWLMDSLMVGVGVGWMAERDALRTYSPKGNYTFIIEDTRESWAKSVRLLVDAFTTPGGRLPIFDYSGIRTKGLPIRGFGGLASGPEPLMKLHQQIKDTLIRFHKAQVQPGLHRAYDIVQLKSDLANMIGCCVVAGNVRRSAEIGLGWIDDPVFRDLKDYERFPEREEFGWMSNNTVMCEEDSHFALLSEVAKRVPIRGEPGVANLKNFRKGRLNGKKHFKKDLARGSNPCGEICLEHRETCNVVETNPTGCPDVDSWYRACGYASFYASTVSLLPTHQPSTNAVVTRNRRIGVGIIDYTGWVVKEGQHNVIRLLRKGYDIVSSTNRSANAEAGVPQAIKCTTIKPGGTIPKLPGKTSGAGYATFRHTLRRTRIAGNHPMLPLLLEAGIPVEAEINDPKNTYVFEYPILQSGRTAEEVTIWEQAMNIVTLQREWADNAVSNTIYFKPKWILIAHEWEDCWSLLSDFGFRHVETGDNILGDKKAVVKSDGELLKEVKIYQYNPHHEEDMIELVLSSIMPHIKTVSFLPHSAKGVYKQMPEEGIIEEEYNERLAEIDKIDWSRFHGSDGEDEKYCVGDVCLLPGR